MVGLSCGTSIWMPASRAKARTGSRSRGWPTRSRHPGATGFPATATTVAAAIDLAPGTRGPPRRHPRNPRPPPERSPIQHHPASPHPVPRQRH
ncbi:hypothetical protein WM41_0689 [Corynebacterium simulans]|uniref:Uncharacterized protein n=1 Tax=Corynebacterium simulans TaxID=146827 RepID=A0ABR5VBF7_9CORY|nr:hypothetical protein WM41_0689 [Corynebacterium simulans]